MRVIGLSLATEFAEKIPSLMPADFYLPAPYLPASVLGVGLVCAVLVALLSAIIPVWRLRRAGCVAAALARKMTMLKQIAAVSLLNIKSLPSRLWSSLVIVVGMTVVIAVLLSMLSLNAGYVDAQFKAGDPGRALVLANGPENEFTSSLNRDQTGIIINAPGIRKDNDGAPLAEGEVLASSPALRKTGIPTFVTIRGFGPKGFALRPEIKIVSGRMVRPGAQELLVGKAAQDQLAGMQIGDKVILPNGAWPVVGVFSTGGDITEGELIADRDTLMSLVKRADFNIVIARLENLDAMGRFKAALAANPALQVMAERQSDHYALLSAGDHALFSVPSPI